MSDGPLQNLIAALDEYAGLYKRLEKLQVVEARRLDTIERQIQLITLYVGATAALCLIGFTTLLCAFAYLL